MSSNLQGASSANSPVPVPRTGVPLGITDPVEKARAELKAALSAIEEKANLPKRAGIAADRAGTRARAFAKRKPAAAVVGAVGLATAVGVVVWGAVRIYLR
ncbi:hypothetical protein FHX48_000109 [Microbacterium halimionae]|uniref:DUF3618 domain-containing protein n=1 Tax=Microbacterium halimionae TaxID=1526413 RepID=A0A7W3JLE1_9MICO|nr:hypothetical protein [Microbacterium halimionae]MBA8815057.1 hypothetical protein [Microbacterium halimionae]NII94152.1 hypothetical protein [Microbacterium halimionae]